MNSTDEGVRRDEFHIAPQPIVNGGIFRLRRVTPSATDALRKRTAEVAKLVDAPDLGSGGAIHRGSSPLLGTLQGDACGDCQGWPVRWFVREARISYGAAGETLRAVQQHAATGLDGETAFYARRLRLAFARAWGGLGEACGVGSCRLCEGARSRRCGTPHTGHGGSFGSRRQLGWPRALAEAGRGICAARERRDAGFPWWWSGWFLGGRL